MIEIVEVARQGLEIVEVGNNRLEIVEVARQGAQGIPGVAAGAVRYDQPQSLTQDQQAQAQTNLDLPWNYALLFNALIL